VAARGDGVIQPLSNHDRSAFSCGVPQLDAYFREQVSQDAKRHAAACFVLLIDGALAGFYTLSAVGIPTIDLPPEQAKGLPRYAVQPATLLGRLALAAAYQGQGWGGFLLIDALRRAYANTAIVGAVVIIVDAKDQEASDFYQHFGFIALPEPPLRLFLPMQSVRHMRLA
jgi:GNAT superfamily N-acetyltransferase